MSNTKSSTHSPRFVRGGANLFSISLVLAFSLSQAAIAGPLPVSKDVSPLSNQSQQNFATLRSRAVADGTVRIDIMLTSKDKTALATVAEITQH